MASDEEVKMFIAFTNTIIKNVVHNYANKENKYFINNVFVETFEEVRLSSGEDDECTSFFDTYNFEELEKFISDKRKSNAISKLNNKQKELLFLQNIKELSTKEIAEKMNTTESNIWKMKSRIVKTIKQIMEEK